MNDAFEQFHAALDDLWKQIKWPFDWALSHPVWVCVYVGVCLVAIAVDLFLR